MSQTYLEIEEEFAKAISEALTTTQRIKAKRSFQKNKAKIKAGRRRAKNKTASKETLKKRAQKDARRQVERGILGDKSKSDLSFSQRQALEKRVDKKKHEIKRLTRGGVQQARKRDQESRKSVKKEDFNYQTFVEHVTELENATVETMLVSYDIEYTVEDSKISLDDIDVVISVLDENIQLDSADDYSQLFVNDSNGITNVVEFVSTLTDGLVDEE